MGLETHADLSGSLLGTFGPLQTLLDYRFEPKEMGEGEGKTVSTQDIRNLDTKELTHSCEIQYEAVLELNSRQKTHPVPL